MIDIVIPYINGEDKFEELRYALRSIEENFKTPYRIVIIGDMPKYLNHLNVFHIPHIRHEGTFSKVEDQINKMNVIINHSQISDPFIYTYDDIYFLKPITEELFKQNVFALTNYKNIKKLKNSVFRIILWNTYDAIIQKNPNDEVYVHECHLPYYFYKKMMNYVIGKYDAYRNHLAINTLYMYEYSKANELLTILNKNDEIKAGFYGADTDLGFGNDLTEKEILKILSKKTFLNHDDLGLTDILKKIIINKFNKPSICEQ